jgi:hypothetical protein
MPIRRPSLTAVATALVAFAALALSSSAHAEARMLDDREMRSVWGRADTSIPAIPGLPSSNGSGNGNDPGTQLQNALMKGATASMLDEHAFLAEWKARTGSDARPPTYDGREVVQLDLNAEPVTLSFDLMTLLGAAAGGGTVHGPSGGMITLQNIDARGTTLWVWGH